MPIPTKRSILRPPGSSSTLATMYLGEWNGMIFQGFDYLAPFSKFKELWEKITCGQLQKLLGENNEKNLPFQIRQLSPPFNPANSAVNSSGTYNAQLEGNYIFTAVVYWGKVPEFAPRIFDTPTESNSIAYAEVHLFQPKRRLVWRLQTAGGGGSSGPGTWFGPLGPNTPPAPGSSVSYWQVARQDAGYFPTDWNLLDQNWACQLAPATQRSLAIILQTAPNCRNSAA